MRSNDAGFTLVEILVATTLAGLIMAGGVGVFVTHHRAYDTEQARVQMTENLRVALSVVADAVRSAGAGVPSSNLGSWIPWYSGFATDPVVIATAPPGVTVAHCSPYSVAHLRSAAVSGATTLQLSSAISGSGISDLLDADTRRLILLDGREHVHVTGVSGDQITIDTDPTKADAQGLSRGYPIGTTLCRVDVLTFFIATNTTTGRSELRLDEHHGGDDETVADGIDDLDVTVLSAGVSYQVGLNAEAALVDRLSGANLTGSLVSQVTLRN